ncbi:MAG: PEP-CTERM sorting domain-containing protein [Alphaproteobacteria bacterium]|nr:PEP-CTERM sorting domain-containing protein [Alphaproteobacteria bacterium]
MKAQILFLKYLLIMLFVGLIAGPAKAAPITIPVGLNPGDQYRLAFVTSTTTDAVNTNISFYNNFVTSLANSVSELADLGTTWTVIGSSGAIGARNNTNTNPNTETGVGIYRTDGNKIADDNADLWDGHLDLALNRNENGNAITGGELRVWTGTDTNGSKRAILGGFLFVTFGKLDVTGNNWIARNELNKVSSLRLYAISDVLTVADEEVAVPAPGSLGILALGLLGIGAMRRRSQRKRYHFLSFHRTPARSLWLVLTTFVVVLAGGKPVDAGVCVVDGGIGTYSCSGTANAGTDTTNGGLSDPLAPGVPVTINTVAGFGLSTAASQGFNIESTGGLSFTDANGSSIIGSEKGIRAFNDTSGAINITSNGPITGSTNTGLQANNQTGTTDINLSVNQVTGANGAIVVVNSGTGSTTVTSTGVVSGSSGDAISIVDNGTTSGATTVTTSGQVTSTSGGYGIDILKNSANGDLVIDTAGVKGSSGGIRAQNFSGGGIDLTVDGIVKGTSNLKTGIHTASNANKVVNITLNSGADVISVTGRAIEDLAGHANVQVNAGAKVTGAITLGDGNDTLTFDGGNFNNVRLYTGGNGTDSITFRNRTGSLDAGDIFDFESIIFGSGADISVSDKFDADLIVESGGNVTASTGNLAFDPGDNDLTVNGGSVTGDVRMLVGVNTISVGTGGTITGDVFTSASDDVMTVSVGGTVTGNIAMEDDSDTLTVSGSVTGNIDMGTGADNLTLRSGSTFSGAVALGNGNDVVTFDGGDVSTVASIDGGNGTDDRVNFENVTATMDSSLLTDVEKVNINDGATVSLTGTYDQEVSVNTGGTLSGGLTQGAGDNVLKVSGGTVNGNIVTGDGVNTVSVDNSGMVTGNITSGIDSDAVTVSDGSVDGNISTGDGVDTVKIENVGSVTGDISTSAGNDIVSVSDSTVDGDIGTGTGADNVTINAGGGVTGTIETGGFTDTVTINSGGTLTGDLSTSDGADTILIAGGTVAGNVTTGGDADIMTVSAGGAVNGTIGMGNGNDSLTFDGGGFSGVTSIDGGNSTGDSLTFRNTSGTVASGVISNIENVVINTNANVSLNGVLTSDLAVNSGGTVGAGNSPGLLNIVGNLDLGVSSTTLFELAGLTPGVEIGGYDVIDVADDPGTGGTTEDVANIADGAIFDIDFFAGFMATLGDTFDVLVADSITVNDFDSLMFDFSGAVLAASLGWNMSLHDLGNGRSSVRLEVVADAVPEPGTLIVFGVGLLGIGAMRRRLA